MPNDKSWSGLDLGYYNSQSTMNSTMNAKHLGTSFMYKKDEWEPQRTNNFELVVEDIGEITTAGNEKVRLPASIDRLMLSVANFTAPSLQIAQITTHYANNSVKWAGKPEFPNSSITVNDYIGAEVEKILSAWFRAAYDFKTEKVGLAKNYKKTAYLIEYDPQGTNPRIWQLEGCWIADFNLGEWNQEGNQQRQIQATFVYDRIFPKFDDGREKVDDKADVGYTSPFTTSDSSNSSSTEEAPR